MRWLGIVLLATGLLACDRNVEPYDPSEKPSLPDLSHIFPEAAQAPPRGSQEPGPGPPGPPAAAGAAASSGAPIAGQVVLAAELAGRAPRNAVLFVIARRDAGGGPPLAVKRIPNPTFPVAFEIGPGDRMIPAIPFRGPLRLRARLDQDGNATTRTPGDLQGTAASSVEPGARGVRVVLDRVL